MTLEVVLLGHHIDYSASPAMHRAAFAALGIDATYHLADVPPHGLASAVGDLRGRSRLGANVTQPHKLAVCDLVDELAPAVQRLGAANTIVCRDGALIAHNTDLPAVASALREIGPIRHAVVLGTGGASRAVQAALADAHADVTVVDRAHWHEMAGRIAQSDLVVNATPIGTGSDETPIAAELLRPDLTILDLVYRPTPTRLVREARAVGAKADGGAGILLAQAALSLELWTGRPAPVGVMAEALRSELRRSTDA